MRVLILDENLIWSARLRLGIEAMGHEAAVLSGPADLPKAELAIVNLGSRVFPPEVWIAKLHEAGTRVVAHAGHKDKPLLERGKESRADLVVTNGELTHKLPQVVERALAAGR